MAPFYGWGSTAFRFTLLLGASKGFMKTFKTFIEPFEVAQRSLKKKNFQLIFSLRPGSRREGLTKPDIRLWRNLITFYVLWLMKMFLDSIMTNAHKMAKHLFEILQ